MGLRLIRQKSDTPNVQNTDDARMVRYAYGGYDGVVKNKGTECSYTINGTTFKINSGVLVLQGWETEIDGNGWEMSIDSLTKYYAVYLEVNLATDTAAIKSTYATGAVPSVDSGDDLTITINGTARMTLYTFKTSGDIISEVEKKISVIEYIANEISEIKNSFQNEIDNLRELFSSKKISGNSFGELSASIKETDGKLVFVYFRASDVNFNIFGIIQNEYISGIGVAGGSAFGSSASLYTMTQARFSENNAVLTVLNPYGSIQSKTISSTGISFTIFVLAN